MLFCMVYLNKTFVIKILCILILCQNAGSSLSPSLSPQPEAAIRSVALLANKAAHNIERETGFDALEMSIRGKATIHSRSGGHANQVI